MSVNHTRVIVKNTVFLYIRTFILLILSVYTSRVLLAILGIEDYGLYNLLGGVVGLFASLKGLFASAVQRFLNYGKGLGDSRKVREIFNLSLLVHLLIAILFIALVEVFGLWFITNKLVIPEGSYDTALFVFHCSIITAAITILSTPYDAAIIANEKINVFAWVAVFDGVLKLLIIFLLPVIPFEKLRVYAVFIVLISLLIRMISVRYCRRFDECRMSFYWNRKTFLELASFAGWNFFGNTAFTLVNEGLNMLLNMFGGVVANAARGIAYQVKAAVTQLSVNLMLASQPYIVQQSVKSEKSVTFSYIHQISRAVFFIMLITVSPIIIYCRNVLDVWLVETPLYAVVFVQIILVHVIIRTLHNPLDLSFKAFGKIKRYQIIDASTLVLSLPIAYLILKAGFPVYSVFIVACLVEFINLGAIVWLAKVEIELSVRKYVREVIAPCFLSMVLLAGIGLFFYMVVIPRNLIMLVLYVLLFVLIESIVVYAAFLNVKERKYISKLFSSIRNKL